MNEFSVNSLNKFTPFGIVMKTPFLPMSDLEMFASHYLGIKDDEFETFYEQYYGIPVGEDLEYILDNELYSCYF